MLHCPLRIVLIGLALAVTAASSVLPAAAQERCEGTLCDLYYGSSQPPATAAQPASPRPLTAPNSTLFGRLFGGSPAQPQPTDGNAPARKPLIGVQGGGLVGLMQGSPQDRCSGTLCDLYYGGMAPERPEPVARDAAVSEAAPAADMAPQTEQPSRVIEQPEERHCADTRDPWSCYRR